MHADPGCGPETGLPLDAALARGLGPVKDRPYVVFHDAYSYFEKRSGLTQTGSITVDPDRKPSAARLAEIRERIADTAVITTVIEGTGGRTGILDPLAPASPLALMPISRSCAPSPPH